MLDKKEWQKIINNFPFGDIDLNCYHSKILFSFLSKKPNNEDIEKLRKYVKPPEKLVIKDNIAYLLCPNGYGISKLSNNFLETKLNLLSTTRNLKTIIHLNNFFQEIPEIYQKAKIISCIKERDKSLMEREYLNLVCTNLKDRSEILDLGCGFGDPIAKFFIDKNHNVTGIDSSPYMIKECKKSFPSHSWLLSDMRTLNLNKKFSAIIAWDSFFHLNMKEQKEMFKVFALHAKQNSYLLFTSGPNKGDAYGYFGDELIYHASLSNIEYRTLLEKHGFEVVLYKEKDPKCGNHTVWVAKYS